MKTALSIVFSFFLIAATYGQAAPQGKWKLEEFDVNDQDKDPLATMGMSALMKNLAVGKNYIDFRPDTVLIYNAAIRNGSGEFVAFRKSDNCFFMPPSPERTDTVFSHIEWLAEDLILVTNSRNPSLQYYRSARD